MNQGEIENWASSYIRAQYDETLRKNENHPDWWAVEKFMFPGSDDVSVQDCWAAILEILATRPDDKILGILAAGPLEDLIEDCGPEIIEAVESEAQTNPEFLTLLREIYKPSNQTIAKRIEACLAANSKRRNPPSNNTMESDA